MIFRAKDVDLSEFPGITNVGYFSKNTNINTQAVQVTAENIGKLCLEFESELVYNGPSPAFGFVAKRGTVEDPAPSKNVYIEIGVWIVSLWAEIHTFRDHEFVNTFTFDVPGPWDNRPSADLKTVAEMREELSMGGHSLFEDQSKPADAVEGKDATIYIPVIGDTEDKDVYAEQQMADDRPLPFEEGAPLQPFVADRPKQPKP